MPAAEPALSLLESPLPVVAGGVPGVFHCPGERQSISRSVHLARLAAGHAACARCPDREQTGSLPNHIVAQSTARCRRTEPELLHPEGLRGAWQNVLTRERMAHIVQAVVDRLDRARQTQSGLPGSTQLRVVLGHDFRTGSADVSLGAMAALQRSGCDVADVSSLSRAAFEFTMLRLRPDAGLYITGGTMAAGWTGLDILDENAVPWCAPGRLTELVAGLQESPRRPTRLAGQSQILSLQAEYESALADQFHAIRPLRVLVICSEPPLRALLSSVLASTPCHVSALAAAPGSTVRRDQTVSARRRLLLERRVDLAFLVEADGRACRVFDETGIELTPPEVLALLQQSHSQETEWRDAPSRTEVIPPSTSPAETELLRSLSGPWPATDGAGRYWFPDMVPRCDAVVTLARLLAAMSLTDRRLSEWVDAGVSMLPE